MWLSAQDTASADQNGHSPLDARTPARERFPRRAGLVSLLWRETLARGRDVSGPLSRITSCFHLGRDDAHDWLQMSIPTMAVSHSEGKPVSDSDRCRSPVPKDGGHLDRSASDAGGGSPLWFGPSTPWILHGDGCVASRVTVLEGGAGIPVSPVASGSTISNQDDPLHPPCPRRCRTS